jgi:hypothetical protein
MEDAPISLKMIALIRFPRSLGNSIRCIITNVMAFPRSVPVSRTSMVPGRSSVRDSGEEPRQPFGVTLFHLHLQIVETRGSSCGRRRCCLEDFIYVEDICRGLMACADQGGLERFTTWPRRGNDDLGSGGTNQPLDRQRTSVKVLPRRDWDHSGRRFGSTVKARQHIGFSADTDLEEGLMRTISWTRQNLPMIEACMNRHASHMKAFS